MLPNTYYVISFHKPRKTLLLERGIGTYCNVNCNAFLELLHSAAEVQSEEVPNFAKQSHDLLARYDT